ncbi:MAG: PIG-L deacetylase family protein [Sideroxydans sp.]|jgi:LmbE family N-acetylglucosaminyl deacetylase
MKVALVIAAHPDDEVLGCGATIARLADEGWSVHVVIVAEGATSRNVMRDPALHEQELSELARCAEVANGILGAASVKLLSLPDNRMDGMELLDVVKIVETEIERHRPGVVLTHHAGDVNVDHRVLHDAVITACRPQPGHSVRTLLFFEVPSSTEWRPAASGMQFSPDYFYDVTDSLDRKLAALNAYAPEMRAFPHPRSVKAVEHLAGWRGATIGCAAAEAFMLGRAII